MAADFYSIWDNFKNFIGGRTGLFHWGMFCLALVFLFLAGRKQKEEKQAVLIVLAGWYGRDSMILRPSPRN